jgi:4-amino-4-deoxy-L-arabinose transferase-like glycosyltransferase
VYIVYRTVGLLFDREQVALSTAVLYAIEPLAVLFSSLLSTEALFTTILMVGVYYLVKYLRIPARPARNRSAPAGAIRSSMA